MGRLTRAQLVSQAGLAAGNDLATSFVHTWLNAWLQRTAKSWAWPVLKERIADLSLPASTAAVAVGAGTHTTLELHRIFNPMFVRSSDYAQRGRVLIRELITRDDAKDESVTKAADRLGLPTTAKIRKDRSPLGQFTINLDPVPDKQYYLSFDAHVIPADLTTDTQKPWYEEDRTLLQACKVALMELDDGGQGGEAYDRESAKLAAMVVDDRDFNGQGPGDNVLMGLDPGVFR